MESQQLFTALAKEFFGDTLCLVKKRKFKNIEPPYWPWTQIFRTVLSYVSIMRPDEHHYLGAVIETKNKSCQFFFKISATYFFGWKCGNFWIWFLLISKVWTISNSSLTERVDQINNKNSIQTKLETFALNSSKAIQLKQPG